MAKAEVLIITGDGLNCEQETAYAFELAGLNPNLVHFTDLLDGDKSLSDYQILAFIGGFSNGDHLGAGTVQAARFKHKLGEDLSRFIQKRKPIIGICNGFQTIVKMGILPGRVPGFIGDSGTDSWTRTATIMTNDSGKFEDRWVYLRLNPDSPCIWTNGIEKLFLPVRHGEGKFFMNEPDLISRLFMKAQVVAQYTDSRYSRPVMDYPLNPNGSLEAIAGICDETGAIFGLMPHPEAYLFPYNHPSWTRDTAPGKDLPPEGQGGAVFRNAADYLKGK